MNALLPWERLERVWAWGGSTSAMSWVHRPTTVDGIRDVFRLARSHGLMVGLRGAGQSYGDAALAGEQICLDLSRMTRIIGWDPSTGVVTVEPGVTIGQLWRYVIEDGWWPPVVPGTMFASLGGCAAANIHGKNNWKAGPIGDHIQEFELLLPSGEVKRASRTQHPDLFHAAIGGFGMLGCFVSITLKLKKVHSGLLRVEPLAVPSLDAMIRLYEERLGTADYLVGWLDAFPRGASLGRGLVHQANYLEPGEDAQPAQTLRVVNQELPDTFAGVVPKSIMWRVLRPFFNDPGMRLVNAVKYHSARLEQGHRYRQPHAQFAFLLDYVPGWKRSYGPGGLIQYQSFIPADAARGTFGAMIELAHERGILPYLGVFKRHRRDDFLLSHAVDGYSLALDFKVTARRRDRLWALAREFNRIVVTAGGRFYFAKDSTLTRDAVEGYMGAERLARFAALKAECDPENLLQTDLSRRLFPPGRPGTVAEQPERVARS